MFLNSRTGKNARQYVERQLVLRLRILFLVFIGLLAGIVYEVARHYVTSSECIGTMMMGLLVGSVFVRRKRIFWEEETSKVIARMDRIGIFLLVVYILYFIARHLLLPRLLQGNELTAFSLSLAAGTFAGRLLTLRSQIRQILKERKII